MFPEQYRAWVGLLWMILNEVTNKDSFHMYFKHCKCLEDIVMYS